MKKLSLIISGLAIVAGLATSCKDSDYTELYDNPSKTSTTSCDKLMTGVFKQGSRDYLYNSYWRMYTWDNAFAKYAQTVGYNNNSGSVYYLADAYVDDRWENFYTTLAQFRALQDVYNKEDDTAKASDILYSNLAEVFILDQLTQCVDIFGDMPYTKAGTLGQTGSISESQASYDNDEDIYSNAIDRLGEIYTWLNTTTLSNQQQKTLTAQDFICGGDKEQWLRYINSLRLRLAVHVAAQGTLTDKAKTAIKACVNEGLWIVDDDANNIEVYADLDGFNYWENFRDGYKDINNVASQPMIDAMTVVPDMVDPRLYVMYQPNAEGNYVGKSRTEDSNFQSNHGSSFNEGGKLNWGEHYYSYLDSCTFTANNYFISPVITAAEVHFLKAEAYINGWAGQASDALTEFEQGMLASIKFYYRQNNHEYAGTTHPSTKMSPTGYVGTCPSDAECIAYADKVWGRYASHLEAIMTMKWVHFGAIQPTQAYTDIRRTGYPTLSFPTDTQCQNSNYKELPCRILWPGTEKATNTANYTAAAAVQADQTSTKLFWAK